MHPYHGMAFSKHGLPWEEVCTQTAAAETSHRHSIAVAGILSACFKINIHAAPI